MKHRSVPWRALLAAFPHTIPILTGFLFLGMTYGIYMRTEGFSIWYPLLISITVVGLHLWKRQILLSIAGGTACYMVLLQTVF